MYIPYGPYAPCMEYLPTQKSPKCDEFSIHGASGYCMIQNKERRRLCNINDGLTAGSLQTDAPIFDKKKRGTGIEQVLWRTNHTVPRCSIPKDPITF